MISREDIVGAKMDTISDLIAALLIYRKEQILKTTSPPALADQTAAHPVAKTFDKAKTTLPNPFCQS
jgi:hypothetical protein